MPTITKIIDSGGTPGVNCDFDTIEDWATFVAGQSNPDQLGLLRGEHGYPALALDSFDSFGISTTQAECPRLVGDPGWQAGHSLYGTSDPIDAPHLYYLTLNGTFDSGNMRHFKLQGVQVDALDVSLTVSGETNAGVWFDAVATGYTAGVQIYSSALENNLSVLKVLFTNCLFVGDGSSDSLIVTESLAAGSYSVALVNSVLAKGATVTWGGNSSFTVSVLNCVQMAKEGYGFQTNAAALTVGGNASYPPSEHADQLNPVYTLGGSESNPGVFVSSDYYYSDYRLVLGSPLIDLGVMPSVPGWDLTGLKDVAGTSRPRGAGFDVGLYEYPTVILETSGLLLCF